jgi:plasmid maintenance system antidote protein VapI
MIPTIDVDAIPIQTDDSLLQQAVDRAGNASALARALGLSRRHVTYLLAGRRRITLSVRYALGLLVAGRL